MYLDKNYYPKGLNPIHEVCDWAKVRKIVRDVLRGDKVNPILVGGENLLAGTHRAAANDVLEALGREQRVDTIDFDDLDEEDHEDFCELKEAIEDGDFEKIDELWDR